MLPTALPCFKKWPPYFADGTTAHEEDAPRVRGARRGHGEPVVIVRSWEILRLLRARVGFQVNPCQRGKRRWRRRSARVPSPGGSRQGVPSKDTL